MCGRFTLFSDIALLENIFGASGGYQLAPRYNIAPTQTILAVRAGESGSREFAGLRWGLIPSWAKDPSIGSRMLNARCETVHEKPAYRRAVKSRRCLIPADGFYEWKKAGKDKQPHFIRRRDRAPLAFAGLWERWQPPEGEAMESCTILTTSPNELMSPIHDRMPVIISSESFARWLNPVQTDAEALAQFYSPFSAGELEAFPVGNEVNKVSNQGAGLIAPVKSAGGSPLFEG
jgi:putative SOS response-associated peptidase YedK